MKKNNSRINKRMWVLLIVILLTTSCLSKDYTQMQNLNLEKTSIELEKSIYTKKLKNTLNNRYKISISELSNQLNEKYYLSDMFWINENQIILKLISNDIVVEGNSLLLYKYDIIKESLDLFYSGRESDIKMSGNSVVESNDRIMYIYNVEYCIIFDNFDFVKKIDLTKKFNDIFGENTYVKTSINISSSGMCTLSYLGDIITFPIDDIKNYEVVIEKNDIIISNEKYLELFDAGIINEGTKVPATYYYLPLWSPDGRYIAYNEREITKNHESVVKIFSENINQIPSLDFEFMDTYQWSSDSKYIVGCTWPTYASYPEVRILNIENGEIKEFLFDKEIEGIKVQSINVLDSTSEYILVSCLLSEGRPLLLVNIKNDNMEWITEPSTKALKAVFSPNGEKIIFYNLDSTDYIFEIQTIS